MDNCKVLIVEDEALVAHDICMTLRQFGYSVVDTVDTAEASIQAVRDTRPDIVIMDIILNGPTDGIQAAELIRKENDVPIIFLSTFTEEHIVKRATTQLPYGYLLKPFRDLELGILLDVTRKRHLIERSLHEKNQILTRRLIKSRESETRLQEISLVDELTGVYNRRGFHTLARHQSDITKRSGRSMIVCFFDLDQMKSINDVHGHGAGDTIIRAAADVLKRTYRSSDIIARWGGDEFVVLMINGECEEMRAVDERIARNIDEYNDSAPHNYLLSMSWGTARYDPAAHEDLDDAIARADAMMYGDKTGKRA
jgi:two-component system, cell cycle response regulator